MACLSRMLHLPGLSCGRRCQNAQDCWNRKRDLATAKCSRWRCQSRYSRSSGSSKPRASPGVHPALTKAVGVPAIGALVHLRGDVARPNRPREYPLASWLVCAVALTPMDEWGSMT
jgi:hypothetical protein